MVSVVCRVRGSNGREEKTGKLEGREKVEDEQKKHKEATIRMKCRIWGEPWSRAHPAGSPRDKGERLRTDGSPTDEDHGPVLHLGNTEHAWGKGKMGREGRGKESALKPRWTQWYDNPGTCTHLDAPPTKSPHCTLEGHSRQSQNGCPWGTQWMPRTPPSRQKAMCGMREVQCPPLPLYPLKQPRESRAPSPA